MIEERIESGDSIAIAAWLSSIASLVIEKHINESRQGAPHALAVGVPTKARRLRERWRTVEPHVKSLSPRQRQVVRLRFREGMCYADIAGRLGVPIGTVRSRLARARVAIDAFTGESTNPVAASPAESRWGGPADSASGAMGHSPRP